MTEIGSGRAPLREALTALFADPRDKAFFFEWDGVLVADRRTAAPDEPIDAPVDLIAELERVVGGAVAVLGERASPADPAALRDALARAPASLRGALEAAATRIDGDATIAAAICDIMATDRFAGRAPVVFAPAGGRCEALRVARLFGGTAVAVGPADAAPEADIVLDDPRAVEWVVRDFIAHTVAERHAASVDAAAHPGGDRCRTHEEVSVEKITCDIRPRSPDRYRSDGW